MFYLRLKIENKNVLTWDFTGLGTGKYNDDAMSITEEESYGMIFIVENPNSKWDIFCCIILYKNPSPNLR